MLPNVHWGSSVRAQPVLHRTSDRRTLRGMCCTVQQETNHSEQIRRCKWVSSSFQALKRAEVARKCRVQAPKSFRLQININDRARTIFLLHTHGDKKGTLRLIQPTWHALYPDKFITIILSKVPCDLWFITNTCYTSVGLVGCKIVCCVHRIKCVACV